MSLKVTRLKKMTSNREIYTFYDRSRKSWASHTWDFLAFFCLGVTNVILMYGYNLWSVIKIQFSTRYDFQFDECVWKWVWHWCRCFFQIENHMKTHWVMLSRKKDTKNPKIFSTLCHGVVAKASFVRDRLSWISDIFYLEVSGCRTRKLEGVLSRD